jgi:hypothetical protein
MLRKRGKGGAMRLLSEHYRIEQLVEDEKGLRILEEKDVDVELNEGVMGAMKMVYGFDKEKECYEKEEKERSNRHSIEDQEEFLRLIRLKERRAK